MFSDENPAGYTTISDVIIKFLEEKNRELRPDTLPFIHKYLLINKKQ